MPNDLTLPDDIRADLLRSQTENLSVVRAPRIKIMGAGAGLYEFTDTGDTVREFEGVILNAHNRNTFWEREYGSEPANEAEKYPACVSPDGRYGVPRAGFEHAALDGPARGDERPACGTCPYNQWGSASMLPWKRSTKGKACTNQKSVFVVLADRELPVEVILPPTSLKALDSYLLNLANRGVPVQTVVTKFAQERVTRGANNYSVATFTEAGQLDPETFQSVLDRRSKYMDLITPTDPLREEVDYTEYDDEADGRGAAPSEDDVPF